MQREESSQNIRDTLIKLGSIKFHGTYTKALELVSVRQNGEDYRRPEQAHTKQETGTNARILFFLLSRRLDWKWFYKWGSNEGLEQFSFAVHRWYAGECHWEGLLHRIRASREDKVVLSLYVLWLLERKQVQVCSRYYWLTCTPASYEWTSCER